MSVGEEVRSSLDHWSEGQWRQAMAHATVALEETAAKRYPTLDPADRFKRTVRDDVDIFGGMAGPEIDFVHSRFPVPVHSDQPDGRPDIADLLYAVHRYLQGNQADMRAGCDIEAHAAGIPLFNISKGHLWLRATAALGLLAIAVGAPENRGESIPGNYQLGWQQQVFHVVGWWGWRDHLRDIFHGAGLTLEELDFGPEWPAWAPVG
ncbi:hypothetical protein [Mycolicibacterium sp.]|uniref:hypothetical protein n=1 Tax=Mycolicibacterium sp. TaxID=2320850 RepID=UPI0028AC8195|nr:hypothetical protein [Mycolicibacterium sp.]